MINARREFEDHVRGKEVLCSKIMFRDRKVFHRDNDKLIVLHKNYTADDYEIFLESLNFEYEQGYKNTPQNLFGQIWYIDGTWSDRSEAETAEWWTYRTRPEIPEECGGEDTLIKGSGRY